MARERFSISLPSVVKHRGRQEVVPDSRFASEFPTGTSRRKPEGWLEPTYYGLDRTRYDRHEGLLRTEFAPPGGDFYEADRVEGCVGSTPYGFNALNTFDEIYTPQGVPNSWRDRALTKARLAMKDQSVNLGVAFAERDRTARLVGDTALQLANAARNLRRGNWKKAAENLGLTNPRKPRGSSLTSKWLEYRYGWEPLLQDVHGSAEALAKRQNQDWRVTGKGSVSEPISVSQLPADKRKFDYGLGTASGMRGVFVRIDAVKQNDLLQSMSSLGVTNPGAIAWELVPFSFIVDWFLPVGDFLNQVDAMLGFGPTSCSISEIEKVVISHKLLNSVWEPGGTGDWRTRYTRSGRGYKHYVQLRRYVYSEVPLPNLPRFKNPLSLGHMANGLSVLAQVFGGSAGGRQSRRR